MKKCALSTEEEALVRAVPPHRKSAYSRIRLDPKLADTTYSWINLAVPTQDEVREMAQQLRAGTQYKDLNMAHRMLANKFRWTKDIWSRHLRDVEISQESNKHIIGIIRLDYEWPKTIGDIDDRDTYKESGFHVVHAKAEGQTARDFSCVELICCWCHNAGFGFTNAQLGLVLCEDDEGNQTRHFQGAFFPHDVVESMKVTHAMTSDTLRATSLN